MHGRLSEANEWYGKSSMAHQFSLVVLHTLSYFTADKIYNVELFEAMWRIYS